MTRISTSIRLDEKIVEQIDENADDMGVSRNQYLENILGVLAEGPEKDLMEDSMKVREIYLRMQEIENQFEEFRELAQNSETE